MIGAVQAGVLRGALVTAFHLVPDRTKKDLAPIIGRFLTEAGEAGQ